MCDSRDTPQGFDDVLMFAVQQESLPRRFVRCFEQAIGSNELPTIQQCAGDRRGRYPEVDGQIGCRDFVVDDGHVRALVGLANTTRRHDP